MKRKCLASINNRRRELTWHQHHNERKKAIRYHNLKELKLKLPLKDVSFKKRKKAFYRLNLRTANYERL